MKKKVKKAEVKQVFGNNFLVKSGRALPIYKCFICEDEGLITMVVIRSLPNGHYMMGSYLIDNYCLGLKNTNCRFDLSKDDMIGFVDLINESVSDLQECTYATVHNWIYGGIEYADELGFKPHKDFSFTKYLLALDNDDIELIEFEFGKDGKPFFIAGPFDNSRRIMETLRDSIGEGNFDFVAESDQFGNLIGD